MNNQIGYIEVAKDVPNVVELALAPAGLRIVAALDIVARGLGLVLQITCGSNGHPPADPHTLGEALDVRSHTFPQDTKLTIVPAVIHKLSEGTIDGMNSSSGTDIAIPISNGWATTYFFGFLEAEGTPNEHFHFQRRKGMNWPPIANR